jgi:hypothetical protein
MQDDCSRIEIILLVVGKLVYNQLQFIYGQWLSDSLNEILTMNLAIRVPSDQDLVDTVDFSFDLKIQLLQEKIQHLLGNHIRSVKY